MNVGDSVASGGMVVAVEAVPSQAAGGSTFCRATSHGSVVLGG